VPSLAARWIARACASSVHPTHPDDKPPLVEGDLFSSLFEGSDVVTRPAPRCDGDGRARDAVDARSARRSAARWKDTRAARARDEGIWCIADVEYRGDWPFANKGKLSATLAEPF
jgi:hypothetical protein